MTMEVDVVAERGQALAALAAIANGTSNNRTLGFIHVYMEMICQSISLPSKKSAEIIPIKSTDKND